MFSWRWSMQKEPTNDIEAEFYNRLSQVRSRFAIQANFEDIPIDFEIGKEWVTLDNHCHGFVQFRCFSAKATELINGVKRKTKSAHNYWDKGAIIFGHYHSGAEEWIYLVHGTLEVRIINDDLSETETVYESSSDQPIIIKKGQRHIVKALTEASFVVKFVF